MTDITVIEADEKPGDCRIAIVISRYNGYIGDRLLGGCLAALDARGVDRGAVTLVKVPGAYEIPAAARKIAAREKVDAVITLGAIIRGETPHFDFIAQCCASGIADIAAETGVPVAFGVLTVDTSQQALDRSGDEESNKGFEAANTALDMISVLRKLGS